MHDINTVRDNPHVLVKGLSRRGWSQNDAKSHIQCLVELDQQSRRATLELNKAQARQNQISKEIGQARARKETSLEQALKEEAADFKEQLPRLQEAARILEIKLDNQLAALPNLPASDVPDGKDEKDNVIQRTYGTPKSFKNFKPREHFEIGEFLRLMDFETAAKISGARFVVLKGMLARLERALAQFMLDLHTREHGYEEVAPPLLVREQSMFGTAQLPKFEEDQFSVYQGRAGTPEMRVEELRQGQEVWRSAVADDDLSIDEDSSEFSGIIADLQPHSWLIPTAEVPLTNLVRESSIEEAELPLRYTAGTYCFRAEAGAAGKDTRGMIRQHQFYKVELVSITTPEKSYEEHERMTVCAEEVLKRLDLHYRTVLLCTGDMGFASQKTYDIEVWLPGQKRYREISSCSICGDFQARRMKARYKDSGSKRRFVHTLNGSGVAVGRALVAVLETYQNEDGSVTVPPALRSYMGGLERIEPRR